MMKTELSARLGVAKNVATTAVQRAGFAVNVAGRFTCICLMCATEEAEARADALEERVKELELQLNESHRDFEVVV